MSTVFGTAKARVASATQPAPASRPEPKLRVVYGAPFRPPRMPFVLFVVALLGAGLVGLLLLNTELQRGTFQVTALNQQADQLRDQQEQLERQVRTLESPQNLADRALRMGMVPNPNPVFLRLSDGKVLGVPEEGKAGTGTAMFGPGTPTGTKPSTPPATTKPPTTKPPTTTKPPATKPPGTKPPVTKPPATKPPTGTTTAKPPTGQTRKPPSTPGTPAPSATTGARTNTPTGG
jgi:outer membrane biosynthesis protein TonB